MELICPKCNGAMRSYERNGVHVDQCVECRGIFLDRGEMERLVDAENSWHGPSGAAAAQQPPQAQRGREQSHHDEQYRPQHGGYPQRKKKSFLDELFG